LFHAGEAAKKKRRCSDPNDNVRQEPHEDAPWWQKAEYAAKVGAQEAEAKLKAERKAGRKADRETVRAAKGRGKCGRGGRGGRDGRGGRGRRGGRCEGEECEDGGSDRGGDGSCVEDDDAGIGRGNVDSSEEDIEEEHKEGEGDGDEKKEDDGGLGDHLEGWEDEVQVAKGDKPGRHVEEVDGDAGIVIRHPPQVADMPDAPHALGEPACRDGYQIDDVYLDSCGVCYLVPADRVLGRIWQFGSAWKAKCLQSGHSCCERTLGAQQMCDLGIKDPCIMLKAWLLRSLDHKDTISHTAEPMKLFDETC
jgi:hypothetical protein